MTEHLGHSWTLFSQRTIILYKVEPLFFPAGSHITVYDLRRKRGNTGEKNVDHVTVEGS